jgi:hypothetical protein
MAIRKSICALIVAFMLPAFTHAQWLKYPTPGIPRTADGSARR